MPRRSWRDLADDPPPGTPGRPGGLTGTTAPEVPTGPELLHRAAAGDSRLADLLAEREQLESQLSALSGPSAAGGDPRFPVTGLQERRAEIASWARSRDARAAARAGLPFRGGGRTGVGRLGSAMDPRRSSEAGTSARSQLLGPLRSGLGRFDQVRSALERADEALERPQQLADGLTQRWEQAKEHITAPMDEVGHYAEERDRILDVITGGSGDLTARAEEARRRALDRRSSQAREERRAARRHERHHEQRTAEQRETDRLDRRSTTKRGV